MIARVSNSQNAFLTYQKHNPGDYLHLSWKPTKDRHMFLNLLNTIQRVISKTTRHTKSMAKCNLFKFDENLIPNIMYCLLAKPFYVHILSKICEVTPKLDAKS